MGGDRISRRACSGSTAAARPLESHCPLLTTQCKSAEELLSSEVPEIRAYKLGKKRWSYNQCEVKVFQEGGDQRLEVVEAVQYGNASLAEMERESGVTYQVRLSNGCRIRVHVFVVYDEAKEVTQPPSQPGGKAQKCYKWPSVSRAQCKKGCQGPVLRSIQRFGRLGKRSGNVPPEAKHSKDKIKEAKYMYLSIDEAGTHVNVRRFRLIVGAYDQVGHHLLGVTCSAPIRVLANNDVPSGAAFISMQLPLSASWDGWLPQNMKGAMRGLHLPSQRLPPSPALTNSPLSPIGHGDQHATRSHSSNDTSFSVPHLYEGHGSFLGPYRGSLAPGHMPQMTNLGHHHHHPALGGHMLAHDDHHLPGQPALVQTGAAGLSTSALALWHDTATSELPPPHKRPRVMSSSTDDVLAAFPEINDVEGAAAMQAHLDQLANLLPPISHPLPSLHHAHPSLFTAGVINNNDHQHRNAAAAALLMHDHLLSSIEEQLPPADALNLHHQSYLQSSHGHLEQQQQHIQEEHLSVHGSPQLDPPHHHSQRHQHSCAGMHSPHMSASQPHPLSCASPSQSEGFTSHPYLHQENMVKKEEHNAAVGGIPENADEDDEEEHEKVESWTNSLINQGSFDASHLKDTPGWQRWLAPHVTGSDEAEEAPLGGPLAGPLGGPTGGSLPALLQLLENESEPLHNGNAPLAPSGITENLMHSFMQAYCGEVAGLPFDPPPTGLGAEDFLNDHAGHL